MDDVRPYTLLTLQQFADSIPRTCTPRDRALAIEVVRTALALSDDWDFERSRLMMAARRIVELSRDGG